MADRSAGLLSGDILVEVELHLANCEKCRQEEARLSGVMRMVEVIPEKEPPYGLWFGIEQRITRKPERAAGWWSSFGKRLTIGFATAAALLALAVGGVNFRHNETPQLALRDGSAHVMQYASLGADQPFADRVSLGTLAGAASDEAPISQ